MEMPVCAVTVGGVVVESIDTAVRCAVVSSISVCEAQLSPGAAVFALVHKFDLVPEDARNRVFDERAQLFINPNKFDARVTPNRPRELGLTVRRSF
jgi:hypothetical protein